MKDASMKLLSIIVEKQACKKHISHIDKSRRITDVIGILYKQKFYFQNDFCAFKQMDVVELNVLVLDISPASRRAVLVSSDFLLNLK